MYGVRTIVCKNGRNQLCMATVALFHLGDVHGVACALNKADTVFILVGTDTITRASVNPSKG